MTILEEQFETGIDLFNIPTKTSITIKTKNSTYFIRTINGNAVSIKGGSFFFMERFPNSTKVNINGSLKDGYFKDGWILLDGRMEITDRYDYTLTTSRIISIKINTINQDDYINWIKDGF